MIRHRLILLASLVPLAAASPAAAQLAPGISGFSSAPTNASEGEYWEFIRRLGLCLADAKEADARAFLAATPGSAGETAVFGRLFHRQTNSCMGNFVAASFPRAYVRGAIAEGFVKMMSEAERAAIASRAISDVSDVRTMHDFARCYVAQQPATALAFLAETRAISAIEKIPFIIIRRRMINISVIIDVR